MKLKWDKAGLSFERICKPGKLVVGGDRLIDLTNGEEIYRMNPDSNDNGIYPNYYGDKFYIFDYVWGRKDNYMREYDTKTRQFIRKYMNANHTMSPEDDFGVYNFDAKSFIFKKALTGELLDSVYYPSAKFNNEKSEFSYEGRYFAITLYTATNPQVPYFYLYDRTSKEFIFEGKKDFVYCLFNNSSKIAYAENLKLDGDDATYSYIRIYDLDQRKVIQDIKIAKEGVLYLSLRSDDKMIVYGLKLAESGVRFYNIEENRSIDYIAKASTIQYSDEKMLYSVLSMRGYEFDWTVDVEDNQINEIEEITVFPNQTSGLVNIPINCHSSVTYKIFDINGILIKSNLVNSPSVSNLLTIDCSDLLKGVYTIQIICDKNIYQYQLVKGE